MPFDDAAYTKKIIGPRWKRLLHMQAPYRWNIRRLDLGYTLDVGCGIGRNLLFLDRNGVGVDVNVHSVAEARKRGLTAYTPDEFVNGPDAEHGSYDSLLFAHILEHMTNSEAAALVGAYLPYLRPGGRTAIIVPQEAGFAFDPTHVEFVDAAVIEQIVETHALESIRVYSFPFPHSAGRVFRYNETIAISRRP